MGRSDVRRAGPFLLGLLVPAGGRARREGAAAGGRGPSNPVSSLLSALEEDPWPKHPTPTAPAS
jgi:hypothetical protein